MEGQERSLKATFLGRTPRIDCPRSECPGAIETAGREIVHSLAAGTGSGVVLRCDRQPERHVYTLRFPPFDPQEQERLEAGLRAGRPPECTRCGTVMAVQSVELPGVARGRGDASSYGCPWCGVRWTPRGQVRWSADDL